MSDDTDDRLEVLTALGTRDLVAKGDGDGSWVDLQVLGAWLQACASEVPVGSDPGVWLEIDGWGDSATAYSVKVAFYAIREESDEEYAARMAKREAKNLEEDRRVARMRAASDLRERSEYERLKAKFEKGLGS